MMYMLREKLVIEMFYFHRLKKNVDWNKPVNCNRVPMRRATEEGEEEGGGRLQVAAAC